jgi:hypothetical protein
MSSGHSCYVRGDIHVKGKGIITTYFVKTPFDSGNHPSPSASNEAKAAATAAAASPQPAEHEQHNGVAA